MRLSKRCEYALKALIELAINYSRGVDVTLINDIASKENIPPRYLEQILLILKNSGMLISKRGVGGGYALNRLPKDISLGDVIREIEGPLSPLRYRSSSARNEVSQVLYGSMKEIGDAIRSMLDDISLEDMREKILDLIEKRRSVPNYVI